jgi:hypothetical protein
MLLHIDAAATEADAFRFEAKSLFDGGISAKFDFAARTQHALPRQTKAFPQNSGDLPRRAGKPCGAGYGTVG